MSRRLAVVIAVDGLRASALGAYGNASQATPVLDALASQSVVVEWMFCTSPELADFYHSAWGDPPLPREIGAKGGSASLVTDDANVAIWGEAAGFENVLLVEAQAATAADSVADTALAGLFAVATELIAESEAVRSESGDAPQQASLLWIHARGLKGPWDAPIELRAAQLDEGDPPAPMLITPPTVVRPVDHDATLQFQVAYAAQITVLDECLEVLLAALDEIGLSNAAHVALIGTSGFALGEHGIVGSDDDRLFSERVHVPCLLRASGSQPAPPRWMPLATPRDFLATLECWLNVDIEEEAGAAVGLTRGERTLHEHIIMHGVDGESAIRTANWMMRTLQAPISRDGDFQVDAISTDVIELYVKPDDRWEANEVAALCPDEAERLLALLRDAPRSP